MHDVVHVFQRLGLLLKYVLKACDQQVGRVSNLAVARGNYHGQTQFQFPTMCSARCIYRLGVSTTARKANAWCVFAPKLYSELSVAFV